MVSYKHGWFYLCLVVLWTCSGVRAHVVHPCLNLAEQAAMNLKQCSVQKQSAQCRDLRQKLSDQVEACRKQQFTDEDILAAIREGERKVKGKPSFFLPPEQHVSEEKLADISQGNIENFARQFSAVKAFPVEDLTTGANQGGCRNAFLAQGLRYLFFGDIEIKRYTGDKTLPERYQYYFFCKNERRGLLPCARSGSAIGEWRSCRCKFTERVL